MLIGGQVVTEPRDPGVHRGSPKLLFIGVLADGHLDQWRTPEKHLGPAFDKDRVVAHAGQVGATGG